MKLRADITENERTKLTTTNHFRVLERNHSARRKVETLKKLQFVGQWHCNRYSLYFPIDFYIFFQKKLCSYEDLFSILICCSLLIKDEFFLQDLLVKNLCPCVLNVIPIGTTFYSQVMTSSYVGIKFQKHW